MFRARLREMFAAESMFEVVGECDNVMDAISLIDERKPDAVVLDLHLTDGSGTELLELTSRRASSPCMVVLTNSSTTEVRARCTELGAAAVMDKATEAYDAVRRVAELLDDRRALALVHASASSITSESGLRRAQRLATVGELSAGIAHDLNNVLTALTLNVEAMVHTLAGSGSAIPPEADELRQGMGRARTLLHRLLTFARGERAVREAADLREVVRQAASLVRPMLAHRVTLGMHLGETPLWAEIDAALLEQVVLNLLINARDAIIGSGSIHVTVRNAFRHECVRLPQRSRDAVVIEVSDTGRGIADEQLHSLFDPFRSSRAEGTGLGLYMARTIVGQQSGAILVDSVINRGSTFTIVLPRGAAPAGAARASAETRSAVLAPSMAREVHRGVVDDRSSDAPC